LGEDLVEFGGGGIGGCGVVELCDDGFAEEDFGLFGVGFGRVGQLGDFVGGDTGQQGEVILHHIVRDAHNLAEHIVGLVGDADVVALGLAHFLFAVEADEDRHGDDDLRGLVVGLLYVAANEVVEGLVGAAKLYVAFDHNRVVALHQGVEEFVGIDVDVGGEALLEGIALEHLGDGLFGGNLDKLNKGQFGEPFAVVPDFEFFFGGVEDFAGLLEVGFCVLLDFLGREDGPCCVLAGWVADSGGVVADDEDGLVAEVLELAHFAQDDGVAEVDIGAGGVQTELNTQLAVFLGGIGELLGQLGLGEDLYRAAFQ